MLLLLLIKYLYVQFHTKLSVTQKKETRFKYDNTKVKAILQTFAISIMPHKIADISILRANIVV